MIKQENTDKKDNSFECYLKLQAYVLGFTEVLYSSFGFKLVANHATSNEIIAVDFMLINTGVAYDKAKEQISIVFKSDLISKATITCFNNGIQKAQRVFDLTEPLSESSFATVSEVCQTVSNVILDCMRDENPTEPLKKPAELDKEHYLKRINKIEEVGTVKTYSITLADSTRVLMDLPDEQSHLVKPGGYLYYLQGTPFQYVEKGAVH